MGGTAIETDRARGEDRRRRSVTDRVAERLGGITVFGHRIDDTWAELRRRRVPMHWTSLFGVISLASLVVVVVTGLLLMVFYTPSSAGTIYTGSYAPLHGAVVSKAFASTMNITFDVAGGVILRQAHHWAALLLPAAIIVQLVATFFTGAFRRPRRAVWLLLVLALIAALASGWSGYALPDDMLSGTGLRIVEGIILGIPVVGTWLASVLFGGPFPGRIIENLYPLHIVVFPGALLVLIALRAVAAWRHRPPQFPGRGRTPGNVVGVALIPTAAGRAGGLFLVVTGLLLLIAATVTVGPIWLYGPADPGNAGAGSQPDWYTGFLDGALRLVPPGWEIVWLGRTWTMAILAPLAVVGAFFAVVAAYPFLEEWVTGDRREQHLLDRPRLAPTRTGLGVAGLTFVAVLWAAGGADIIATSFSVSIEHVIGTLQVALIVGPCVAFTIARRICFGLQRKDADLLRHGYETGRIVRLPGGEYVEVHQPLDETERARLGMPDDAPGGAPRPIDPETGPLTRRLRRRLRRYYEGGPIDAGPDEHEPRDDTRAPAPPLSRR
ncbi:cytochrome bc complex cytochrome b subunit [Microbacterium yannicii]|uniref:Cytochrome bc1 complex cytochrome b subunit n=1 Tax=Microbacterium yannicii TaxID=671622 RepID=A0ABP9MSR6_9MICO|nr:cytochrome b N-terminal domain-containing protein [Microbacterium yannicii]MCO5953098.1 cytochrome b N-terminal domain-containing protein [Microbacterium yannicii]